MRKNRQLYRQLSLLGILALLILLSPHIREPNVNFAQAKQVPSHVLRQQEGLGVYTRAGKKFHVVNRTGFVLEPTKEEKNLTSQLKRAGESKRGPREWQKLYARYSGCSPMVLTAAMQAALKQRDYKEGYKVYKRIQYMTLPTYSVSMKLLGKLAEYDEVERLWANLMELNLVDEVLAAARIDAAANNGDIQGAARILNYMGEKGIGANLVHFTSAINACANANAADRAKQAQVFFDRMATNGIEPNIVTYVNLLRAYSEEPSECCLHLLADMQEHGVKPNVVFAENFLFIFLKIGMGDGDWRNREFVASYLRNLNPVDLQFANSFIDDLRRSNVRLTKACKLIDAAIQMVQKEEF